MRLRPPDSAAVSSIVPAPSTRTSPVSRCASLKLRKGASAFVAVVFFFFEKKEKWAGRGGPGTFHFKKPQSKLLVFTFAPHSPAGFNTPGKFIFKFEGV